MQESAENLNTQAIELAANGAFFEAVACLKRAITIDKKNYLLWFNLGITYRNSGDLIGARKAFEKASELCDEDAEVFEMLGLVCLALEDYNGAFAHFMEGLSIDDANAHLWNNLGVLHFSRGEYTEASEAFEEALTIFPHYYDALFNLRDTYSALGNDTGAAICDERLKNLPPPKS